MREVLRQLASIPGVVGALASGPKGELLAAEFPPLFDDVGLNQAAALLADETAGFRRIAGPDGLLQLRYANGRALLKPFASGTLLVLGTAGVDAQLLGLSLEQASRRLEKAPAASAAGAAGAADDGANPPAELASAREGLTEALARQIGPVAGLVFEEAWSAWSAAGSAARARLPQLVAALAREVDDPEGRARFLDEARRLLG